jgi:hypothetical protein
LEGGDPPLLRGGVLIIGEGSMRATATVLESSRAIRVVRFYKMDHLNDPTWLPDSRIVLGVNQCKGPLRRGIREHDLVQGDNLVLAVGGVTAIQGLADRVCWGGIPVARQEDGAIELVEGFYLAERGPLDWRERFPLAGRYVNTVTQGHRVNIPEAVKREFIAMFQWAKELERKIGRTPAPQDDSCDDASCSTDTSCPPAKPVKRKPSC